jgi:hypothetical protein
MAPVCASHLYEMICWVLLLKLFTQISRVHFITLNHILSTWGLFYGRAPKFNTETRGDEKSYICALSRTSVKFPVWNFTLKNLKWTTLLFLLCCEVRIGNTSSVPNGSNKMERTMLLGKKMLPRYPRKPHEDVKEKWLYSPTHSGS